MKTISMRHMHDPENGVSGDCMRACVASILELDYEDVPAFETNESVSDFNSAVIRFFDDCGYGLLELGMPSGRDSWNPLEHFSQDYYHLIYGETNRGTYHCVVGKNGEVVFDPHPSRDGILQNSKWVIGLPIPYKKLEIQNEV